MRLSTALSGSGITQEKLILGVSEVESLSLAKDFDTVDAGRIEWIENLPLLSQT